MKDNGADGWAILSSQGQVVFYVALHPDCTVDDIAEGLRLTPRSIWAIVGDLRRAGMIESMKEGRRNRYHVLLDGPFRHPTMAGVTLRTVLAGLRLPSGGRANGASARR